MVVVDLEVIEKIRNPETWERCIDRKPLSSLHALFPALISCNELSRDIGISHAGLLKVQGCRAQVSQHKCHSTMLDRLSMQLTKLLL